MKSALFIESDDMSRSPSTRRVWIEINEELSELRTELGHPPHGGCGLKFANVLLSATDDVSPSTRRVWIEILSITLNSAPFLVTLHTEGVD